MRAYDRFSYRDLDTERSSVFHTHGLRLGFTFKLSTDSAESTFANDPSRLRRQALFRDWLNSLESS